MGRIQCSPRCKLQCLSFSYSSKLVNVLLFIYLFLIIGRSYSGDSQLRLPPRPLHGDRSHVAQETRRGPAAERRSLPAARPRRVLAADARSPRHLRPCLAARRRLRPDTLFQARARRHYDWAQVELA